MMRLGAFTFVAAAACAMTLVVGAQAQPAGLDGVYDPGPASAELAQQPQTPGAKGDQERHYFFEEAGVEMPYRIYVPESYDPSTPTPLVVALHGYAGDQDYFFRFAQDVPAKSDEHGFIFVAPMGYNYGGWYGLGGPATRGGDQTTADIMRNGHSVTELSEMDVMHVIDIVRGEYNIDPDHMFLMGHSMGGAGTWYLGQKHTDMWAGMAPMSGSGGRFFEPDYTMFKDIPMLVAAGGEETASLEGTKAAVDAVNAAGGSATYLEIEGGTHGGMIAPTTPQVLDFFAGLVTSD